VAAAGDGREFGAARSSRLQQAKGTDMETVKSADGTVMA
jgi:hypothetical protein